MMFIIFSYFLSIVSIYGAISTQKPMVCFFSGFSVGITILITIFELLVQMEGRKK